MVPPAALPARPVRAEANRLVVGDHVLHVVQRAELDELPWRELDSTMVKVMAWYDNEWGYANRLADLARCILAART
jgi:glyceraldehyde-3-phosphate dehydrogenase/erythrose-4-phosphate dehydrogenase